MDYLPSAQSNRTQCTYLGNVPMSNVRWFCPLIKFKSGLSSISAIVSPGSTLRRDSSAYVAFALTTDGGTPARNSLRSENHEIFT